MSLRRQLIKPLLGHWEDQVTPMWASSVPVSHAETSLEVGWTPFPKTRGRDLLRRPLDGREESRRLLRVHLRSGSLGVLICEMGLLGLPHPGRQKTPRPPVRPPADQLRSVTPES